MRHDKESAYAYWGAANVDSNHLRKASLLARKARAMSKEEELLATIDLVYEALSNDTLWPKALVKLADTVGAAQVGLLSLDRRARRYDSIAPRTDPEADAIFKSYWAFHNPLWPKTITKPPGEAFLLESLVAREDLIPTPFFNDWFRPAGFGVAAIGANLTVTNEISSMLTVGNAPGKEDFTDEQARLFKVAFRHVNRAVEIHRELRLRDLDHATAPERLEHLQAGIFLVDDAGKLLFANARARTLISMKSGLALENGCLCSTDGSDVLGRLIASCSRKSQSLLGPGGEIMLRRRGSRPSLRVMVTPLRTRGTVAELPWLGVRVPSAMVTASDHMPGIWLH